jgi:hypothetical protein
VTQEERDRKEADLLLRQRRVEKELALRREDAHKVGSTFSVLEDVFKAKPSSFPGDFNESHLRETLDYEKLLALASDIRRLIEERDRIAQLLQVC